MKVVIPMTGYGSRFVNAGYKDLKPFIKVQGRPILEWIVKGMYQGETDFLFICRQEHLDSIPGMHDMLCKLAPDGQIFAIDNWTKEGPVVDIMRASTCIPDDEPCIVNYCDFYQKWDYYEFCKLVRMRHCDGAIPCYSGFHPNLIPAGNLYASCLVDKNDNLLEIREKYSFDKDKFKSRHSPGIYYFRTGKLMKHCFSRQIDHGQTLNGEHYVSLPYNFLVKEGYIVWAPVIVDYFCQWGTPEDLQDYLFWTELTRGYNK